MSIEAGARAGLIAPDDTTFQYISGRPFAPCAEDWDLAVLQWRKLTTDAEAVYQKRLSIDASAIEPMISFGTNPSMSIPIRGRVPDPAQAEDAAAKSELQKAIQYMELRPGEPLLGRPIHVAFIGSCTNSRLSDLRAAAGVLRGRRIHPNVRAIVVPGSQAVKRDAEAEGLDRIFKDSGAEWREAGCSMCIAMNGDKLEPGQNAVSTSNRNFEGRQGPGGRTFLASPLTAAASAVAGVIADPRRVAAYA
jgi:3-isopropylmalate/(R)-2-methylmalate dehydratase large subunit